MTTPADRAGFVIGQRYRLKEDDPSYSGGHKGDVFTFHRDDGSDVPVFQNLTGNRTYIPLAKLEPFTQGVKFEAATRIIETTVITVDRKLSQAEQEEIEAIISKGNK